MEARGLDTGKLRILELGDARSIHVQRWVRSLRDRGHDVRQASFRPGPGTDAGPVEVLPTFGLGKFGYFLAIARLRKLVRDFRPDVIHAQHVTSYGFLAAFSGCRSVILTAWGSDILLTPSKSPAHRGITRLALRSATAVTVVAGFLLARIQELSGRKDAQVIPFGIDLGTFQFRPDRTPFPRRVQLICTRNLEPVYDHATLLEAFSRIITDGVDAELVLVGEGTLRPTLESHISSLGISNRVRFLGRLDQPDLSARLRDADVFVSSSLSDGGSISLVEAMASGCFPVATRIPANEQWIEETSGRGLLFKPESVDELTSHLLHACRKPSLREAAALPNRMIVEQRADWAGNVLEMESLFFGVLGRSAEVEIRPCPGARS